MMKFNREEGLTLIELLITIAVIAIVAAISVPVVANVIDSSNTRAAETQTALIKSFVAEYDAAGGVALNPLTQTFEGYIDLNGDNIATPNEKVKELSIDTSKFTLEGLFLNTPGDFNFETGEFTPTGEPYQEWIVGPSVNYSPVGNPSTWGPEGPTEFVLSGEYFYGFPISEYVFDWRVTTN